MANTLKNVIQNDIGTTLTSVYTVPSSTTTILIGLTLANTLANQQIDVSVSVTDTSAGVTSYIIKNAAVAPGGALVPVGGDQKIILEATDVLKVQSSAATSLDVIASVVEQS